MTQLCKEPLDKLFDNIWLVYQHGIEDYEEFAKILKENPHCVGTSEPQNLKFGNLLNYAIWTNNLICTQIILEYRPDLYRTTENGNTALHIAVQRADEAILMALLHHEKGKPNPTYKTIVNQPNNDNQTPISIALRDRQIFLSTLLEYCQPVLQYHQIANLIKINMNHNFDKLFAIISKKNPKLLEHLNLRYEGPQHGYYEQGETLLITFLKVYLNQPSIYQLTKNENKLYLLLLGYALEYNIDMLTNSGTAMMSPLHIICRIKANRNIFFNIFMIVCKRAMTKHNRINQTLSKQQYKVLLNQKDVLGNTPVMRAGYNGNLEIVKILNQEGADLSVTDNNGNTLAHIVASMPGITYTVPISPQKYISILEYLADNYMLDTRVTFVPSVIYKPVFQGMENNRNIRNHTPYDVSINEARIFFDNIIKTNQMLNMITTDSQQSKSSTDSHVLQNRNIAKLIMGPTKYGFNNKRSTKRRSRPLKRRSRRAKQGRKKSKTHKSKTRKSTRRSRRAKKGRKKSKSKKSKQKTSKQRTKQDKLPAYLVCRSPRRSTKRLCEQSSNCRWNGKSIYNKCDMKMDD